MVIIKGTFSTVLKNFYSQCIGDDTLVMIKDSTPVDRKQLNPNKVPILSHFCLENGKNIFIKCIILKKYTM